MSDIYELVKVRESQDFSNAAGTIKTRLDNYNEAVYPIKSPEHERREFSPPICTPCNFPGAAHV